MRGWCAIVIVGLFVGVAVPCEAKEPSVRKTKAERIAKRAPKAKSTKVPDESAEINTPSISF